MQTERPVQESRRSEEADMVRTGTHGRRPGAGLATVLLLGSLLWVGGCRTPDVRRPLDEEAILSQVAAARAPRSEAAPLTLAEATERLRRNNPRVLSAQAEVRAAEAFAAVPTPRPNPSVDLGPILVGTPDLLSTVRLGTSLAFGWAIPLTGRLQMQDDVNAMRAERARVGAGGTEREEYLALRGELVAVILRAEAVRAAEELVTAADASVEAAQKAVAAGAATRLDTRLLRLEAAEARAESLEFEAKLARASHTAARRMGMSLSGSATLGFIDLPTLPEAAPSLELLRGIAVEQHPRLAALRADYLVAEKELRLAWARRYPDLGAGVAYDDEVENQKLSLPLGIEIPLYDRNQPAIAKAYAERCRLRAAFAAALTEILGRMESARAEISIAEKRLDLFQDQLGPADETNQLAKTMRDHAGGLDMLRFLEVLRATRRVRLRIVRARLELYEAWSALEAACGSPFLAFPEHQG